MKYFGTYNSGDELVPKSYVDELRTTIETLSSTVDSLDSSLNFLYSHTESEINVAYRVIRDKDEKEQFFYSWDNYMSTNDSNYVKLTINPSYRSTSILFNYDTTDENIPNIEDPNFPSNPSIINNGTIENGYGGPPNGNTIYYVLDLDHHLPIGTDIYVYLKTIDAFFLNVSKIRILIPATLTTVISTDGGTHSTIPTSRFVSFDGKFMTISDSSPTTRNGYVDIGYMLDSDYFATATLHIYTDGEFYYIDKLSPSTVSTVTPTPTETYS